MSDLYNPEEKENTVNEASTGMETTVPNETADPVAGTTDETVQKSEDGTYRYSYRKAVENPEEYRKPPYMRDEVGKGNPSDGEPQVRPRLQEFQGIRAAGSEPQNRADGSNPNPANPHPTDPGQNSGSQPPQNNGRTPYDQGQNNGRQPYNNGGSGRPPYNNGSDNGRQPYSSDPGKKNSNGSNKPGKQMAIIALVAVLVGGLVGTAAWNAGKMTSASGGTSALEEIQKGLEDGTTTIDEADPEAESSAENESSGGSVIQKNPKTEVSEGSSLITDLPDVVDLAMPSVVAITTKTVYESYSQYGYNPFFGEYGNGGSSTYEVEGAGSGIIIGDDGTELWIVTNNHVVEDSNEVTVSFVDDEHVSAYIKGTDASNDLAVVGVKIADMSESTISQVRAIQMGDSDSLRLGETVIAIGNALGIGQSVTTGIVSALDREITTEENTTLTTIQTDAAINPGNSGGALLNSAGELIGINVAKGSAEDVEGMGYAIPISNAKEIIERLTTMEPRTAVSEEDYPYLGVQLQDISSSYSSTYGIPSGVMVYAITEDSPAAQGGMINHDIITAFEGVSISSYAELVDEMQYYAAGTTVTVTVSRLDNGEYVDIELSITLGRRADYTEQ